MNFTDLQPIQKQLDEHVLELHGNTHESTKEDMLLALLVELAETAQETRCFKHWSVKGANEREVILEEYVDVLHFVLSRCNYFNVECKIYEDGYNDYVTTEPTLTNYFLSVFSWMSMLHYDRENVQEDLRMGINNFFYLGMTLGFTEEEIREAYMKKNEINYKRQEEGY